MVEIVEPWAIPNLLAGVLGTAVALLIFVQRPGGVQHRAAAAYVWLTGVGWATIFGPITFGWDTLAVKTTYFAWTIAVVAYLWLLSTLDTPLARPLATRPARIAYTGVGIGLALTIAVTPLIYWFDTGSLVSVGLFFDIGWTLIMMFGVFVALSAWGRAPPGLLRRRNAVFALAFGAHDVLMALFLGGTWALAFLWHGPFFWPAWVLAVPGITLLIFQGLLLYGILSTQVFDIDLKIRWGLSRATVGAIFVAAFFAASEIASAILTAKLGVVAGVMVTALLIVVLAPLRRASDTLAGLLVGGAADTAAYRAKRKELVYQAQVEELMADASITAKERRALLRLQGTLELDAAVAARLEREVLDRLVPAAVAKQTIGTLE